MMVIKTIQKLSFKNILVIPVLVLLGWLTACVPDDSGKGSEPVVNLLGITIATDKAMYGPGDNVLFKLNANVPAGVNVRYKYLNETLAENIVSGTSWSWTLPDADFRGYMAELVLTKENGQEEIIATIGIDASSVWTRFPRYGFLSKYGQITDGEINGVIDFLNRCHINGIQFYDWHHKHHRPLAGTVTNPAAQWKDIFNRDNYQVTINKYIDAAHAHNMKAMFYNLLFGTWSNAAVDGVQEEWSLYKDAEQHQKDKHPLPQPPFLSDIYLVNPANSQWLDYLIAENNKVYEVFDFDGFHIDQLGNRGMLYKHDGNAVDLTSTYEPFISAMKNARPEKFHVMNAVSQYGQNNIASAGVDFMYTETWDQGNFGHNANLIKENNELSGNTRNTVLAAYMNYDKAENAGEFNTHSVLLADAEIFAFGGAHLELGEHMLGKEFFPNNNLKMPDILRRSIISYYDFSVAYQNLLRDGGTFNNFSLTSINGKVNLATWPGQSGKVAVIGKEFTDKQVVHFINFTNANTLQWRDKNGIQAEPLQINSIQLGFVPPKPVKKIWFASPDVNKGSVQELELAVSGTMVTFTIPSLKYWDMLVIEY